jgi:hypothetical protein
MKNLKTESANVFSSTTKDVSGDKEMYATLQSSTINPKEILDEIEMEKFNQIL